jgi:hypothetical protein
MRESGIILIRGGSMFVGNQNFTGLWGRNFVGNLHSVYNAGVYYNNIYRKCKKVRGDVNSWARVTHEQ